MEGWTLVDGVGEASRNFLGMTIGGAEGSWMSVWGGSSIEAGIIWGCGSSSSRATSGRCGSGAAIGDKGTGDRDGLPPWSAELRCSCDATTSP